MRVEGDFQRDGCVVARELFSRAFVAQLAAVHEAACALHEWAPTEAYFFHVNSVFEPGSPLLRILLEAAADEGLREVFRLACGVDPTFSHIVAYHEPKEETAGGGWHRDMQYVFPKESEEKARILRQSEPDRTWSGMQVQVALIDGSQHIEYALRRTIASFCIAANRH